MLYIRGALLYRRSGGGQKMGQLDANSAVATFGCHGFISAGSEPRMLI